MAHEKGTVFRNTQWAKTLWPCSGSLCTIMDCHNIRKYSLIRKLSNKLITLVCARRERVPSTYIFVLICIFSSQYMAAAAMVPIACSCATVLMLDRRN